MTESEIQSGVRVRLIAVEAHLRSQALEQWALLDEDARKKLIESLPTFSEWGLDATSLLHSGQTDPTQGRADGAKTGENIRFLFDQLAKATTETAASSLQPLQGVTPLGWLTIFGALIGAVGDGARGRGLSSAKTPPNENIVWTGSLAKNLSITAGTEGDPPWSDLDPIISVWTGDFVKEVFRAMTQLDDLLDIVVKTPEPSPYFVVAGGRGRTAEVSSSMGTIQIPIWQVSVASIIGEGPRDGIERFRVNDRDPRLWYRWSETWHEGAILSVGAVQPGMASLAGLQESLLAGEGLALLDIKPRLGGPTTDMAPQIEGEVISPESAETRHQSEPSGDQPSLAHKGTTEITKTITPATTSFGETSMDVVPSQPPMDRESPPVGTKVKPANQSMNPLNDFRRRQEESWRRRAKSDNPSSPLLRHARVALFQWEIENTYDHPILDSCARGNSKLLSARMDPSLLASHESTQCPSCSEHRRRMFLRKTLETCRIFGVDILVLPEYSVRPETVTWLRDNLGSISPATTVWAGTYFQHPFLAQKGTDPNRDWSAIIPVVLPDGQVIDTRTKKYPSLAAKEVFNPSNGFIEPIFKNSTASFDVRNYILELICSEVFLATSPANFYSLVWVQRELARRFGKGESKRIEEIVAEDVRAIARHTSQSHYIGSNRRSIVLVPALTPRTVDFAVLGQASFLAAGLTTVFCNAVEKKSGRGQSCFIGYGGWDQDCDAEMTAPGAGPYHNAEPGIYRPYAPDRGWLGRKEQALVIADIDPLYAAEGRPRPQTLPPPLRLVAHLPIIESWETSGSPDISDGACRCMRMRNRVDLGFASAFWAALFGNGRAAYTSTCDDVDPKKLGDALEMLSKTLKDDMWLKRKRSAYMKGHASDPQPWPPPVALDWIWVDLGDPESQEYPSVEIPPFCKPPGGA
jgi:hypothetical protein